VALSNENQYWYPTKNMPVNERGEPTANLHMNRLKLKTLRKFIHQCRGIYGTHLKLIKKIERLQPVTGWTLKYRDLDQLCPKVSPDIVVCGYQICNTKHILISTGDMSR
jgi:hypothetical protein